MNTPNPYAPPQTHVADVSDAAPVAECPPLWNPNAAASWSLLFSPIFGAYLQMKNWEALGEMAKADTSRKWFKAGIAFFTVIMALAVLVPESKALDGASNFGSLVLLLGWYFSNGKTQNPYVVAKYGKRYPRKGWSKPLLFAVVILVGVILITGLVAFALATAGILS